MKIRIKGNSIRIRLTQTEVANFAKTGYLEEKTEFGDTELTYVLQSKPAGDELTASFNRNIITMWVPEHTRHEWTTTDIIGFENKMPLGDGKHLFLLIEKDFVCLDNTFEDQSDNYPNPNAAC
jgi:hypothetical protein